MSFSAFGLDSTLLATIEAEGYTTPTPIQTEAIPLVLEGRDLFGLAQTGTGKTAAFALPILNRYLSEKKAKVPGSKANAANRRGPRCLVLTPTRELALQVGESFSTYGRKTSIGVTVVFGGVGIVPQKMALRNKPEILVATPGRLLDLMGQGDVDLSSIDVFILDEADRMFDMGFVHDIRRVVAKLPTERQTLLFSATMPDEIAALASGILKSPARVEVCPNAHATETVTQSLYFVCTKQRVALMKHLLEEKNIQRCIVFTRMKHMANRIAEALRKDGISAEAFHANKSQSARVRALAAFKSGESRVLVATDIAARGLDVDDVEVVINYDLPQVPETYVHRIGRAGRAGKTGLAWNLCDGEQQDLMEDIERVTKVVPEIVRDHPFAEPATLGWADLHQGFRQRGAQGGGRQTSSSAQGSAARYGAKQAPRDARPSRRDEPRRDDPRRGGERPQSSRSPRGDSRPSTDRRPAPHRGQKPRGEEQQQRRDRPPQRDMPPRSPSASGFTATATAASPRPVEDKGDSSKAGIRGIFARLGLKKKS